jgi:hypothetical protein
LKLKILEAKVIFWCGTHMTQLFLKKFLIFDFPFSLKLKWKPVRSLLKFCKNQEFFQKKLCHVCAACEAAIFFWTWCDSNMITFFYCKTDNLSCLNKKNCLVKLKNFSCVFMSSAWPNTWGSLCIF